MPVSRSSKHPYVYSLLAKHVQHVKVCISTVYSANQSICTTKFQTPISPKVHILRHHLVIFADACPITPDWRTFPSFSALQCIMSASTQLSKSKGPRKQGRVDDQTKEQVTHIQHWLFTSTQRLEVTSHSVSELEFTPLLSPSSAHQSHQPQSQYPSNSSSMTFPAILSSLLPHTTYSHTVDLSQSKPSYLFRRKLVYRNNRLYAFTNFRFRRRHRLLMPFIFPSTGTRRRRSRCWCRGHRWCCCDGRGHWGFDELRFGFGYGGCA